MAIRPEEAALVEQFLASRTPELRERMILHFVPLVHFVLGRLGLGDRTRPEHEDMVSQGLVGLIEAVDRYDAGFGARFSTYATLRIRGRILDHLRSLDWLSRGARRRARAAQEAISTLWLQLGRSPTDEEIAAHSGLAPEDVRRSLGDASRIILSLDAEIEADDGGETPLHERVADEAQQDPAEATALHELEGALEAALKKLSEREQRLLSMYYQDGLTLKEIGDLIGVSESRVCQLHAQAILGLRALVSAEGSPRPGESPRPVAPAAVRKLAPILKASPLLQVILALAGGL